MDKSLQTSMEKFDSTSPNSTPLVPLIHLDSKESIPVNKRDINLGINSGEQDSLVLARQAVDETLKSGEAPFLRDEQAWFNGFSAEDLAFFERGNVEGLPDEAQLEEAATELEAVLPALREKLLQKIPPETLAQLDLLRQEVLGAAQGVRQKVEGVGIALEDSFEALPDAVKQSVLLRFLPAAVALLTPALAHAGAIDDILKELGPLRKLGPIVEWIWHHPGWTLIGFIAAIYFIPKVPTFLFKWLVFEPIKYLGGKGIKLTGWTVGKTLDGGKKVGGYGLKKAKEKGGEALSKGYGALSRKEHKEHVGHLEQAFEDFLARLKDKKMSHKDIVTQIGLIEERLIQIADDKDPRYVRLIRHVAHEFREKHALRKTDLTSTTQRAKGSLSNA